MDEQPFAAVVTEVPDEVRLSSVATSMAEPMRRSHWRMSRLPHWARDG